MWGFILINVDLFYFINHTLQNPLFDVIMPYIIKSYEISKYNPVDLKNNFIELYYSEWFDKLINER